MQDKKDREWYTAVDELRNEFGDWIDEVGQAQVRRQVPKPDVEAQWRRFEREHLTERPPVAVGFRRYGWMGGALAACLLIGFFLFRRMATEETAPYVGGPTGVRVEAAAGEGMESVTVARGCSHRLVLADGTRVHLSPESWLVYPRVFDGPERRVQLQGEAYFEVQPDAAKPFRVETDKAQVCVLGTHFTVRAYADVPYRVSLMEGAVRVKSLQRADSLVMKPGEDVSLSVGGELEIRPTDGQAEMWQKGFFCYDNTSLRDILKDVCRFYDASLGEVRSASMDKKLHFKAPHTLTLEELVERINSLQGLTLVVKANRQINVE